METPPAYPDFDANATHATHATDPASATHATDPASATHATDPASATHATDVPAASVESRNSSECIYNTPDGDWILHAEDPTPIFVKLKNRSFGEISEMLHDMSKLSETYEFATYGDEDMLFISLNHEGKPDKWCGYKYTKLEKPKTDAEVRDDVYRMRDDVNRMREDVNQMREDVLDLSVDVYHMREEILELYENVATLRADVTKANAKNAFLESRLLELDIDLVLRRSGFVGRHHSPATVYVQTTHREFIDPNRRYLYMRDFLALNKDLEILEDIYKLKRSELIGRVIIVYRLSRVDIRFPETLPCNTHTILYDMSSIENTPTMEYFRIGIVPKYDPADIVKTLDISEFPTVKLLTSHKIKRLIIGAYIPQTVTGAREVYSAKSEAEYLAYKRSLEDAGIELIWCYNRYAAQSGAQFAA